MLRHGFEIKGQNNTDVQSILTNSSNSPALSDHRLSHVDILDFVGSKHHFRNVRTIR